VFSSLLELAERVMAPDGGLSPLQRVLVKSVSGDPLTKEEIVLWRKATGRVGLSGWFRSYKQKAANELWFLAGRRAFKTTFGAILTIWEATRRVVPEGQQWTIPIVAPGLRQANKIPLDMIRRKVNAIPEIAPLLVGDTTDSLMFSTGIEVITLPPRVALVQGWTSPMIWCDEASNFMQEDESASDLSAVLDALRPSISTIPGAKVLVTSLPGPKAGTLWEKWESRFDEGAMVFRAASADCNPLLLESEEFQKARNKIESFKLFYSGEFVEARAGLLPAGLVDAAIMSGRAELPAAECVGAAAVGCDFATGGDAENSKAPDDCAAAIAIKVFVKDTEAERIIVAWCRRWSVKGGELHPVYTYFAEIAVACETYGVSVGVGDKESLAAATQFFSGKGVVYQHLVTNGAASEPVFDYLRTQLREGRLLLPDDSVLRSQLKALEERRDGGRSYEVAARKGRDDLAVAVAAAVFKAGSLPIPREPMTEYLEVYTSDSDPQLWHKIS
jgi:hypothetical protein